MKPEYRPFVDELIELCIKEDIGDGDHTSLSCIPAGEHGRMRLLCKQEGIIAGIEIARTRIRPSRPRHALRAGASRRRPRETRRRGVLRIGPPAFAAAGRTHPAQHHAAHERRGDADRRLRRAARRAAHQSPRHPQDHARHARAGQDGREAGRRRKPPHGSFRHDPAERQPHRLRRRHPQGDLAAPANTCKAKGKDIPIECEVRSLEDIDEVFAAGGATASCSTTSRPT